MGVRVRSRFVPKVNFGVKWLRRLDLGGRIGAGVILAERFEGPEGFALSAIYGEQGSQVAGWLRRYEPRSVEALHLLEGIVRVPSALATLLQAAGPGAIEKVGAILAQRMEQGNE